MTNPRIDRLQDELSVAYREADKILVAVASGVIAVSVAFIGNIKHPTDTWAIRASWVLMIITVLSVLTSLLCEQADRLKRLEMIDDGVDEEDTAYTTASKNLNKLSIGAFALGLWSMAWFLWVNTGC